jgi:hypothetical protein
MASPTSATPPPDLLWVSIAKTTTTRLVASLKICLDVSIAATSVHFDNGIGTIVSASCMIKIFHIKEVYKNTKADFRCGNVEQR